MSCFRAWALPMGTQKQGSPVMSMVSPRNSFNWLGTSKDFSWLMCQPRPVITLRAITQCSMARALSGAMMIMLSMYTMHWMPLTARALVVAWTNLVKIHGEVFRLKGHAWKV